LLWELIPFTASGTRCWLLFDAVPSYTGQTPSAVNRSDISLAS
jgi:hypothetical protein